MRIALVVHKFPPASVGGTEVYAQNLARELAARGHEVAVFYRQDQDVAGSVSAWQDRAGFRAYRFSRALDVDSASPWAQFLDTFANRDAEQAFDGFLHDFRPDIVHLQHVMLLSYRLVKQAKRLGVPVLLTLHDYWFLCSISQLIWPDARICRGKALGLNCARCVLTSRLPRPLQALRPAAAPLLQVRDTLVRRAALQADRLIAPSHFLIQQYVDAGFAPDRFIYLENGIDVERIRRHPREPSSDGRIRFTYLGALAWQKGVHVLVQAFRDLPAERAILRVYGDPQVFPGYSARLKSMANLGNTAFEGSIPNEQVGRALAQTDVLVVPSLWYENSPVVIQEAFAAGVPVVGSRLGALAEKIRHGTDGLLFAPGDVMALQEVLIQLISQPARIDALRSQVEEPVAAGNHAASLEQVYRDLPDRLRKSRTGEQLRS